MDVALVILKSVIGLFTLSIVGITVSVVAGKKWRSFGILPLILASALSVVWVVITPLPLSSGVVVEVGLRATTAIALPIAIFLFPLRVYEPTITAFAKDFGLVDKEVASRSKEKSLSPWRSDEEKRELGETYRRIAKLVISRRAEGADNIPPHTLTPGGVVHFRKEHRERIPQLPTEEDAYRKAFYNGVDMMYEEGEDPRVEAKRKYAPLEEFRAKYLSPVGKYEAYPSHIRIGNWLLPKFWKWRPGAGNKDGDATE